MSEIKHTMPDVIYAWDCHGDIKTKATHPDFGYMPATIYTYTRTEIYATETGELKAEIKQIKQNNAELVEIIDNIDTLFDVIKPQTIDDYLELKRGILVQITKAQ